MQVQDTVKRVISRKAGKGTAYTIQLENAGYIGAGFESPACTEGDYVSLQYEVNARGFNQLIKGSLRVEQKQVQSAGNSSPAPAGAAGGQSKNGYWDEKERRDLRTQKAIQYQASRNAAVEVAKMALEHDCLSLGAKKADKLDILLAFIDETTDRFNKDVTDVTDNGERSGEYDQDEQDNQATEVGDFA